MAAFLLLVYQMVLGLALLTVGPFLVARRGRHYLPTLPGRLGAARRDGSDDTPLPSAPRLWIHAVSVGEVGVAATLVRALPAATPLVVTTVTPTGQALARKLFAGRAAVAYLPFDLRPLVRRFWRRFQPQALILVEGDYWPVLLDEARRRGLPVAVVNGRVGDRSFGRLRRVRPLARLLFAGVESFGMQSAEDRDRLHRLGVDPTRLEVTGNLKFETREPAAGPDVQALLAACRRLADGRPLLIAGSTMGGEEEQVLAAFTRMGGGRRALLVLAPRHPERWPEVERLVRQSGLALRRRTELQAGAGDPNRTMAAAAAAATTTVPAPAGAGGPARTSAPAPPPDSPPVHPHEGAAGGDQRVDVLLLDSMGELAALYQAAAGAFIGGTLAPTGGHNPLEPARYAVPIAAGPAMFNFRDVAARFDDDQAWSRVADAADLAATWQDWLDHPHAARALGDRGAALLAANRGALAHTLGMLAPLLDHLQASPAGTGTPGAPGASAPRSGAANDGSGATGNPGGTDSSAKSSRSGQTPTTGPGSPLGAQAPAGSGPAAGRPLVGAGEAAADQPGDRSAARAHRRPGG